MTFLEKALASTVPGIEGMKVLRASNFLLGILVHFSNQRWHYQHKSQRSYDIGKLFWYRFKQFWNKAIDLVFILYAILPHEVCL